MLPGAFELILEVPEDFAGQPRDRLRDLLSSQGGLQIIETEELLQRGRIMLDPSRAVPELDGVSRALREYGGKISIVKTRDKTPVTPPSIKVRADEQTFGSFYDNYVQKLEQILRAVDVSSVEKLVDALNAARKARRQIFVIGNGGSAATASHMANDLGKRRFNDSSFGFRILSLTDNVSFISATANDEGFDRIFVTQLQNLMEPGDLVIAISSSGNSKNVIQALEFANAHGGITWGISGFSGGMLYKVAKSSIHIPTKEGQYGFHEDVSLILNHMITVFIYERDRERAAQQG